MREGARWRHGKAVREGGMCRVTFFCFCFSVTSFTCLPSHSNHYLINDLGLIICFLKPYLLHHIHWLYLSSYISSSLLHFYFQPRYNSTACLIFFSQSEKRRRERLEKESNSFKERSTAKSEEDLKKVKDELETLRNEHKGRVHLILSSLLQHLTYLCSIAMPFLLSVYICFEIKNSVPVKRHSRDSLGIISKIHTRSVRFV